MRCWRLAACGLDRTLFEGCQVTGTLRADLAARWQVPAVPLVAGGGDNAAGTIGVGIYHQGQTMLSLGTSGVYFAVSDGFLSNPEQAVHSFCHALPGTASDVGDVKCRVVPRLGRPANRS